MVAPDSLPSALRASDEDREVVIRMLRDGSIEGRLSDETFLQRVDRALRARGIDELAALLSDLPLPAAAVPGPWSRFTGRLRAAWWRVTRPRPGWAAMSWPRVAGPRAVRDSDLAPLILPRGPRTVFSIGRSPDCDLALTDITVSWHHAELRRSGDDWVLVDLGSTNGTRVNGWRADSGFTIRAGDTVSFGRAAFRLTTRARPAR
jgi:FHA domain/DUF1707 SHOCT-like domain